MRLKSVVMLGLATALFAGCDDDVTSVARPPLAGVRLVNALQDGWTVDIRAVDQVEWSPVANALAYRNVTRHEPTDVGKARRLRVFPTSTVPAVTSEVLHDTTITFQADSRVTLLLVGSASAGTARFVVINDDITPPPAAQIGVRLVNTTSGSVDGYLVKLAADPISGAPTWSNVQPLTGSAYVNRTADTTAVRVTAAGAPGTILASLQGPLAPDAPAGSPVNPAAGVNSAGTKFSVYVFAPVPAVTFPTGQGRPNLAAVTTTTALWLVDRNPMD